jgi:hypothetical protein
MSRDRKSKQIERTVLVVNRDCVGSLVPFLVLGDHHVNIEISQPVTREGTTYITAALARQGL